MRRKLLVALGATAAMIGVFETAVALPVLDAGRGSVAAANAPEWFGYEGVTVAPVAGGDVLQHVVLQPVDGQQAALASLLDGLGTEPLREVGGLIEVAAAPTAVATLQQSPLVASLNPLQVAHETVPANVEDGRFALQTNPTVPPTPTPTPAPSGGSAGLGAIGAAGWHEAGSDGAGVVMAIVDTGFAEWGRAQQAGEVPAVDPADDLNYCDKGFVARPHGTGTAEVLHAVAPKVRLVRVCIDDAMDLAAATTALIGRGDIDIINMALGFYNNGPGDGSGGPGSPDDSARRALAAGIVWVNSAGNEAPLHHSSLFNDTDGNGFHEFKGGDERGKFTVPAHTGVEVFLRWSEWGATPPPDAFRLCFSVSDTSALDCLPSVQADRLTPTTGVALSNSRNEPVTFSVAITRLRGTGTPRLDLFFTDADRWEYPDASSSLVEPAAVAGVVAVGAVCSDTSTVQPASSQGPTLDGRPGISLVAPGASGGDFFSPSSDCQGGYGGTSAAAPYAAGALALLKQADPVARGATLVDELLTRTSAASDPGAPGVDPVYGHGLLALGSPPPCEPPAISTTLSLAVALRSDRRDGVALAGQQLAGRPYVYLTPPYPADVPARAEFYVDNVLVSAEREAPFDLGGSLPGGAFPMDTSRLADGQHRMTVLITTSHGERELAMAPFSVDNSAAAVGPPPGVLLAADGAPLNLRTIAADSTLRLRPSEELAAGVDRVTFFVDAIPVFTAEDEPYTLRLADIGPPANGQHAIRALVHTRQDGWWAVDANFVVGAAGPFTVACARGAQPTCPEEHHRGGAEHDHS